MFPLLFYVLNLLRNIWWTFIRRYLARFNEEIQTIKLKQSLSKHRVNQNASRLSVLEMNAQREKSEFEGAGIGMMIKLITNFFIQSRHWNVWFHFQSSWICVITKNSNDSFLGMAIAWICNTSNWTESVGNIYKT